MGCRVRRGRVRLHHQSARCLVLGWGGRLGGWRQAGSVITVIDPDAACTALAAGELACPQPGCSGRLRTWSKARERQVRRRDGTRVRWCPDRAKCRSCRRSHVLLPVEFLPRRGYDVHVVGAALLQAAEGAGYRRAATAAGVPAGTVRGWEEVARQDAERAVRAHEFLAQLTRQGIGATAGRA